MSANATNEADEPNSIAIILCGKSSETGTQVSRLIRPEFEVIHFVNSFEDAKADIPELIAGRGPKRPGSNNIGSGDYSRPPRAVIFGRAFDPEHVLELHRLFRGTGSMPVAWIAGDPQFVLPAEIPAGYAEKAADNVKRAFAKWEDAGDMSEEIVYY
ncbi:uncharacterized protein BJX67DRAFT_380711 [Aspergillus lucknowensis]|uniref:Uncharacterized protein n=1 Tax=Aspergillus lucknowensis TaxID=176173 RepID=A0ABR4LTA9_9EURO